MDRDALSDALDSLRQRFSPDSLWSDGVSLFKTNSGPYTQAVDAAVRSNPLALAVTAVGLAWLILGRKSHKAADPSPLAGTRYEAEARWEDEGGPVMPLPPTKAEWIEDADRLRLRASGLMARINAAGRDKRASAADIAISRADVAAALAKDVRRALSQGLESLTGPAHEAALASREQVYSAHLATVKVGGEVVRDNPVIAGVALALGGALVAALLPQSPNEKALFAAPRDRVVTDAARVLQDERQRFAQSVSRIAQALTTEITPTTHGTT